MPSPRHDTLVKLFTDRPQLAVEVLRDLMGVDLPVTPLLQVEKNSFNTRPSDDFEADLVIILGPPQAPAHAIIVEVPYDISKDPRQLARHATELWLRLDCGVTILVASADDEVAAHYDQPIESGLTGHRMRPQVLGPRRIRDLVDDRPEMRRLQEIMTSPSIASPDLSSAC